MKPLDLRSRFDAPGDESLSWSFCSIRRREVSRAPLSRETDRASNAYLPAHRQSARHRMHDGKVRPSVRDGEKLRMRLFDVPLAGRVCHGWHDVPRRFRQEISGLVPDAR